MDFAFPTTTTTTTPEPPPCGHLPFPRFVVPAAAAAEATRGASATMVARAEPPPRAPEKMAGAAGGDASAAASEAATAEMEDRMDMLWEDFNEELALAARRRRAQRPRGVGGGSWRDDRGGGGLMFEGPWSAEESSPASDTESEPARAGCGPVLRPSARAAGGARHCRRRAGRWVLLMRIFRRLFVVEKTISSGSDAGVASHRSTTRMHV